MQQPSPFGKNLSPTKPGTPTADGGTAQTPQGDWGWEILPLLPSPFGKGGWGISCRSHPPLHKIPPPAKLGYSLYEREMGVPRAAWRGISLLQPSGGWGIYPILLFHHCSFHS